MVWCDVSPCLGRGKQHTNGRALTTTGILTCIQQSWAQSSSQLQKSLQGLGWQSWFWQTVVVPCPCMRLVPGGRRLRQILTLTCEMQATSVKVISLSHSSLSTLLACFSSCGFCREMVCISAGYDTGSGCLQCSQGLLKQQPSVLWLLFHIPKVSWPPEKRPGPVDGLQSHTCDFPLLQVGHKQPTWW